jgi:molybdate transport system ATP-binding protein
VLNVTLDTHLNTFHLSLRFSAEIGKTTVLLGESGAGKSTVLRSLAGLHHPEYGHISLNDLVYFDSEQRIAIPPQERPFGYVFQDYVLFPHLTVFENVAFGLKAQHLPGSVIRHRVGEALEQVRLAGLDARRPAQLSGGQQQRVAIARALALHPQLLLLDEPLAALDVQTRREIRQELRRILSDVSVTTLLVTHQYLEALLFGHQILVLEHGRILQQGGQRDLLEHPRSSYVAELVGVNFFRGRLVRYEMNAMCVIQLQNKHQSVEVTAALKERGEVGKEGISGHRPTVGEEAYIIVEPRSVTLYANPPDSSARNVFCGRIVQLLHLGAFPGEVTSNDGRVRVSLLVDESMPPLTAEITEASAHRMQLSEGKQVYAAFKATEAWAYV